MTQTTGFSAATRILVGWASFVIVVAGLRASASIVIPFLLSAFIAIICAPPLFWMQRKRVPTALAVITLILVIIIIGTLLVAFIGTSLSNFTSDLPYYQSQILKKTESMREFFKGTQIEIPDKILQEYFNPGMALQMVSNTLTGFFGLLTQSFLILLTVIFILFEASGIPAKIRSAIGDPGASLSGFSRFVKSVNRYLVIKTVTSLGTGILIAVFLAILQVDYPLLWGLLAFLLNYVPNIGSIIAAIPAVLLAFVQFGAGRALVVILGYLVVNFLVGSVLEPKFMGQGLGLSTLVVFLSLVFWGWVLGPVGMVLSVPLTMIVKIALESNEDTKWIAIMLSRASDARAAGK